MSHHISAGLPLVAYAETLAAQARVLVVGDASSALAEALRDRGARLIHVCDGDADRRATAQARSADPIISYGTLYEGAAAVRESFFDLALVENLSIEPNAADALRALRRLLAPRGVALICAPNPEANRSLITETRAASGNPLDYYSLYDAVSENFQHVRMLGQIPFVGYAFVDFSAEGDPSPVLDTSLVSPRGEEPDYFVALAARDRRSLEQYAVVQLPLAEVSAFAAAPAPAPAPAPLPAPAAVTPSPSSDLEQQLRKQEQWIVELEARAATADERADIAEGELDELRERLAELERSSVPAASTAEHEPESVPNAVTEARSLAHELRETLAQRDTELNELSGRLTARELEISELRQKLAARDAEVKELGHQLRARDGGIDELRSALTAHEVRIAELSQKLAARDAEVEQLEKDAESAEELTALEQRLVERGQRVAALERALADTERVGRELVRKLRDASIRTSSDELSHRLAEAEAEIVTLRWSLSMSSPALSNGGTQH